MKQAIYKPQGKAGEYAELALNHLSGCVHGCWYCYVPGMLHKAPKDFHADCRPRLTLDEIEESAIKYAGNPELVLLSFTSDPLQLEQVGFTCQVIDILHRHHIPVTVLTKAGLWGAKVFAHLQQGDQFAVTLTYGTHAQTKNYEPNAGSPLQRIAMLECARNARIPAWVSLEPWVESGDGLLNLIEATKDLVTHYKIGCLNHQEDPCIQKRIKELPKIEAYLQEYKKPYYIKNSLAELCGKAKGYWWGPEE